MTRGHCERVRAFVDLLAVRMGLCQEDQDRLRWAALFHDIGKLRVPGPILRKPGKPTDKEWETLKRHPADGGQIIRPLASWLGPWADAVEQHHERFDGLGYPSGLAGTDISLGGRILAVADAYEVMITSRPYKRPVRPDAARRELVRAAGQQFDPDIVRAFLGIAIGDLRKVMGVLGVLSEVPILATVPRADALIEMAGRHIGAVGSAAGTGAFVAAATFSPVLLPSPSMSTTSPGVHAMPAPQSGKGSRGPRTVSPNTPVAPASGPSNGVAPASPPSNPGSGSSPSGADGSSGSSPPTSSAPARGAPSLTNTNLPANVASAASIPLPAGGTAAKGLASAVGEAASTAVTNAEDAAASTASTAESVASEAASEAEKLAKTPQGTPQIPPLP
jgi:hypothetical protein